METIEIAVNDQDWCDECDQPKTIVTFVDEQMPQAFPSARYVLVITLNCGHEILIPIGRPKFKASICEL